MSQTPPYYQRCEAAHDKFCLMCRRYKDGYCELYEVPAGFNFSCDSWARDWQTTGR